MPMTGTSRRRLFDWAGAGGLPKPLPQPPEPPEPPGPPEPPDPPVLPQSPGPPVLPQSPGPPVLDGPLLAAAAGSLGASGTLAAPARPSEASDQDDTAGAAGVTVCGSPAPEPAVWKLPAPGCSATGCGSPARRADAASASEPAVHAGPAEPRGFAASAVHASAVEPSGLGASAVQAGPAEPSGLAVSAVQAGPAEPSGLAVSAAQTGPAEPSGLGGSAAHAAEPAPAEPELAAPAPDPAWGENTEPGPLSGSTDRSDEVTSSGRWAFFVNVGTGLAGRSADLTGSDALAGPLSAAGPAPVGFFVKAGPGTVSGSERRTV